MIPTYKPISVTIKQTKEMLTTSQHMAKFEEYERHVFEIKEDLKNYNAVMVEAGKQFRDRAEAENYQDDWITDSDSQASVGKADDFLEEQQKKKQAGAVEDEDEDFQGYSYDDDDDDGYGSGGNSGYGSGGGYGSGQNESQDFGSFEDSNPQPKRTKQSKNASKVSGFDLLMKNSKSNQYMSSEEQTLDELIVDGFSQIIENGRGNLFDSLIGWK